MSGELNEEFGSELNLFDVQKADSPLQELYSIYLCYFDEARGHICLFCFPELAWKRLPAHIIAYHPIWFIDAAGRKEHSDSLDFEYQLRARGPYFRHHFFPVQGVGLNQVELEFMGSVYLAAKFSGASLREKKRAGLSKETPETYVLIVEVPSVLRFLGTEILSNLHEALVPKFADNLYLLIEKGCHAQKPIKTEKDRKTIELGTELEGALLKMCQSTIPQISMDILQEKIMEQFDKQEEMVASLIGDLIKARILAERRIELISDAHETSQPIKKELGQTKVRGMHKDIQMTGIELLDKERALEITVRNNSTDSIKDVDAKLIYETEFFEIQSWGTFIPFWSSNEELNFCCQRVPNDEVGSYIFHLDDKEEKLLIRTIKISDLYKKPS